MPTQVLKFTPDDLSPTAKSYLERRFMQEDYKSYWCSISSILDDIAEGETSIFKGLILPEKINWKRPTIDTLPKGWWKMMAFPPKIARAMKAFWKKHPTGEVEWKW